MNVNLVKFKEIRFDFFVYYKCMSCIHYQFIYQQCIFIVHGSINTLVACFGFLAVCRQYYSNAIVNKNNSKMQEQLNQEIKSMSFYNILIEFIVRYTKQWRLLSSSLSTVCWLKIRFSLCRRCFFSYSVLLNKENNTYQHSTRYLYSQSEVRNSGKLWTL